jgi:DNA-binding transcriptional ArsR family regulator
VRRARRLPLALRRELDAFRFAWAGALPDFLLPAPDGGFDSFESELERLHALDLELIAFEFMRPLYDHGGDRDPAKLRDPSVRVQVERRARTVGGDPTLALLLFDDPGELRRRFTGALEAYWQAAFRAEWRRVEPELAAAVEEAGRVLAAEGVYPLLRTLGRRLVVDEAAGEFGIDLPHHHRVPVTEARPLTLVPSLYSWPHVNVNCDEPFPLTLVYPAPFALRAARPRLPDAELLRVLKALADDTRLRALRLIAAAPRSTQELAPLVGISEAGLSKHLRLLAEAGVLETRREGYYVLYSIAPGRLPLVTAALVAYLEG